LGSLVIVPDKNTFSLIVYASRKNQEWIRKLIETLDRRRPQVLIDVVLVEIRKTDEFNYDVGSPTRNRALGAPWASSRACRTWSRPAGKPASSTPIRTRR
jgi:hypothetical protein